MRAEITRRPAGKLGVRDGRNGMVAIAARAVFQAVPVNFPGSWDWQRPWLKSVLYLSWLAKRLKIFKKQVSTR
jgi:hypothetical protein